MVQIQAAIMVNVGRQKMGMTEFAPRWSASRLIAVARRKEVQANILVVRLLKACTFLRISDF